MRQASSKALRPRFAILGAAALSLLIVPAVAGGRVFTDPVTANLDDDPVLEQVIPQGVCLPPGAAVVPPCAPDQFTQRQVVIADSCAGAPYTRVVSPQHEAVIKLTISNFQDITPRPEIFFDLRSGAGGRAGEIRVVSWKEGETAGSCQEPRALFRYPSKYTRGRVPRKAKSQATFDATLRNLSKRYAGKEIRLRETYVDRNDALCCPSFERITLFGYNAGMDLYVKFRSTVKRIRKK
jgi:hypothetical protein